jgi:hypothetical protein
VGGLPAFGKASVIQVSAADLAPPTKCMFSTDPPYYDDVPYADLSDFFYAWLRRTLHDVYPRLLGTLLVPKAEELVADPFRHGGKEAARTFFERGMSRVFERMRECSDPRFPTTIYYAFKQAEGDEDGGEDADEGNDTSRASTGWETFLQGLVEMGWQVDGTWPVRTEKVGRTRELGSNALASSIVLVCRPRPKEAGVASRRDFLAALKRELPDALRNLQKGNIAPVDLAQAAIGPGMAVFSRYVRVLEADGLGSTSISDSRLGARQRMVGITTLFTSEGRYLLGNMSNAVPFEEYGKAVVDMLTSAIERVRGDMNWQKGDEVRLIFHSFKPLKDAEADAVKAVADSLKDYHVDFAFLHVAQEHDTVLFDSDCIGVMSYGANVMKRENVMKGEFAPTRGTYLTLNKSNTILSLTGPREIKKPTDGLPYPVLLHLHRCSTFIDMKYLTEQVYTFAGHSWRSFDMARMPVTIAYSQLIARLLGRLGALPHFSVDSIHGRLNRLRWFL